MEELRQVYNMLEDEQSKDIWMNRLGYLVTGDFTYMQNIIERYCCDSLSPELQSFLEFPKIICYGAGRAAMISIPDWLKIDCFCDKDLEKQKNGFRGYRVISLEELKQYPDSGILITSDKYGDEMEEELRKAGFHKNQILHMKRFIERQKDLVRRQYFDESFLHLGGGNGEVFVDAGAYDLTTTLEWKKNCPHFKKAYAFEPDRDNIVLCNARKGGDERIEIIPYGTWSKKEELHFTALGNWSSKIDADGEEVISVVSVDDTVKERITYLKMDVEGAELETLKGARRLICDSKPRIAVCIYHKPEDMTKIPLYIKSLVPEYRMYVRHYSKSEWETVLYAVL